MAPKIESTAWQPLRDKVAELNPVFLEFSRLRPDDVDAVRDFVAKNLEKILGFVVGVYTRNEQYPELAKFYNHDLKGDLHSIRFGLDRLSRGRFRLITIIQNDVRAGWFFVASAIESMQFFVEGEYIASRELDGGEFLKELEANLKQKFHEEGVCNLEFDFDVPKRFKVKMNRGTVVTLLANMVRNSLKHGKASKIKFTARCEDDQLKIQVSDNGSGIDQKIAESIFKDKGLGLASGNTRMEWMGGNLSCDGHGGIDSGAKFTFALELVPTGT